ncbi:MAG: 3-phosphoshikimate 1-carboxyvinyltransferase [Alphaproteobacteria bacterium]
MTTSYRSLPCRRAPSGALTGEIRVPGDKSISHRALMLSTLAAGASTATGLLEAADTRATADAMRRLGATVERTGPGAWRINGPGIGGLATPDDVLDLGNSGTGARLLLGMLAGHPIRAVVSGDASLRHRPMGRITEPLTAVGASFQAAAGGRLPITVTGARHAMPTESRLRVPSAQVKSALLLAGLNAPGRTIVIEPEPTRDHTERMLRLFGATVTVEDTPEGRRIALEGQPELNPCALDIPGDPSSAAFPLVAALLVPGSEIVIRDVGINPLRVGLFETLREMGADLTIEEVGEKCGEPVATITARTSRLRGVTVPATRAPSMIDEYPILAAAAACADGATTLLGLGELRVKESDRLAAIENGLTANGVIVESGADSLTIIGRGVAPAGGGTVATHLDHRIAMAFLVLGLAAEAAIEIDDGDMIATSFPDFVALMRGLGAVIEVAGEAS